MYSIYWTTFCVLSGLELKLGLSINTVLKYRMVYIDITQLLWQTCTSIFTENQSVRALH